MKAAKPTIYDRLYDWAPIAIIMLGIALRLVVYINNRCLWTDEVAIALNIAEKNFLALAQALDYKQYAPPIFMWLVKTCTLLFGYGEKALRLYPLLSGIGALIIFSKVLKQHIDAKAGWYPLLIFATGIFFLRYSTELKQYMPDALISLVIIWLAKHIDITQTKPRRFALIWLLTGSVAVWSSMPSVFVLAGVGCYYGFICLQHRNYKLLLNMCLIAIIWAVQFSIYYYTILDNQIQSSYLASYHQQYFLRMPYYTDDVAKNYDVVQAILQNAMGGKPYIFMVNKILMLLGIIVLIIKRRADALLLLLPVLLMLFAALIKQYSLIPRLTLFSMPVLLLLIGIGLQQLVRYKLVGIITSIVLLIFAVLNNPLQVIKHPLQHEQMTDALDYITQQKIGSEQLYVYTGAIESYRYYTQIHPDKNKWNNIQNARLVKDNINIEALHTIAAEQPGSSALLYTIPFDSYFTKSVFEKYSLIKRQYETTGCTVFIFEKKG